LRRPGIRGIPASQRLADQRTKLEEQMNAKRQDQLTKMPERARNDVKEMLKNSKAAQPRHRRAAAVVLHDRIQKFTPRPARTSSCRCPI